jgi:hypothetical protein
MRVPYSLLASLIAAAAVVAACGEGSGPLASQGTDTPYSLRLDSVTPNPISVKVGKTVAFKVWVYDNATNVLVPNAAPALGVVADTKIATYVAPSSAALTTSVKGVAAGNTKISVSYVNVNTGETLNVAAAVPVTVTP